MNLKDLLGYGNRKGNAAWFNFQRVLYHRMKKWVKTDKDAMQRLYSAKFVSDYDWLNDRLLVRVVLNGKHIFTIADPDDHEQLNALQTVLIMLDDGAGETFDGRE